MIITLIYFIVTLINKIWMKAKIVNQLTKSITRELMIEKTL